MLQLKTYLTSKLQLLILLFSLGMGLMTTAIIINPLQHGLMVHYYDNADWQAPSILEVRERMLDLYRKNIEFPDLITQYSIQWEGVLHIPVSGTYQFTLSADDAAHILLDQQYIESGEHGQTEVTRTFAKGFYPLTIRYAQYDGPANFQILWQRPGHSPEQISIDFLFLTTPTPRQFLLGMVCDTGLFLGKFIVGLAGGLGVLLILLHRRSIVIALANHGLIGCTIFVIVFGVHFWGSRTSTSFDSMWTIARAFSIIREKNTDLNEYTRLVEEQNWYAVERIGAQLYSVYPPGTPLLAVPFVYFLDRFLERGLAIDFGKFLTERYWIRGRIEIWIASIFVAVTSIGVYAVAYQLSKKLMYALLSTFIFAFCTSMWSVASRALWQHTSSALLLTFVMLGFLVANNSSKYEGLLIRIVSVCLAFSFAVRPTNSLSILVFTGYIFWRYRKHFLAYSLWSLIVAIPFFLYNWNIYHTLLPTYYLPGHHFDETQVFLGETLLGHLFSPSRGLLIFSPILVFAVHGMVCSIRRKPIRGIEISLLSILFLHWVMISRFPLWWGGHSYGPRYFTEMLPYFLYFFPLSLLKIDTLHGVKRYFIIIVLCGCIGLSFFVHFRGARDWAVHAWNSEPTDINDFPERVWDWSDIQFLHGIFE